MHQMRRILFFVGFALLVTHELDAMTHAEWHLLPILSSLEDELARQVFVAAHVPLIALLSWLVSHRSEVVRRRSQLGVDVFLLFHAFIHVLTASHPLYHFDSGLSQFLIFSGGLCGLAHLGLELRQPLAERTAKG